MAFRVTHGPSAGAVLGPAHQAGLKTFQTNERDKARKVFETDRTFGEQQRQYDSSMEFDKTRLSEQTRQAEADRQTRVGLAMAQLQADQANRQFQRMANLEDRAAQAYYGQQGAILGANLQGMQDQRRAFIEQQQWLGRQDVEQQQWQDRAQFGADIENQQFIDRQAFQPQARSPIDETILQQQQAINSGQWDWSPAQRAKLSELDVMEQKVRETFMPSGTFSDYDDQVQFQRQMIEVNRRRAAVGTPTQPIQTPEVQWQQSAYQIPGSSTWVVNQGERGWRPIKVDEPASTDLFATPKGQQSLMQAAQRTYEREVNSVQREREAYIKSGQPVPPELVLPPPSRVNDIFNELRGGFMGGGPADGIAPTGGAVGGVPLPPVSPAAVAPVVPEESGMSPAGGGYTAFPVEASDGRPVMAEPFMSGMTPEPGKVYAVPVKGRGIVPAVFNPTTSKFDAI